MGIDHEWTRMGTNGHEWTRMDTNGHEWARIFTNGEGTTEASLGLTLGFAGGYLGALPAGWDGTAPLARKSRAQARPIPAWGNAPRSTAEKPRANGGALGLAWAPGSLSPATIEVARGVGVAFGRGLGRGLGRGGGGGYLSRRLF